MGDPGGEFMRVIDCFMACYEVEALAVRFAELADVVDAHHAVQGSTTFRGDPREPLPMPDFVTSTIVDMPVGDPDFIDPVFDGATGANWQRDKYLRDASLTEAIKHYPDQDTLFLVCDGDEIPHPEAVAQAVAEYPSKGPRTLRMDYREWYANWRAPDAWQSPHAHRNQPVIGTFADFLIAHGAHVARCVGAGTNWPYCDARGWHLSNLGDSAFVHRKFGQFAHSEVDNDHDRNLDRLTAMRDARKDAIDRFDLEVTDDLPTTIARFPHLVGPT